VGRRGASAPLVFSDVIQAIVDEQLGALDAAAARILEDDATEAP
jgi:hypothetical protein